MEDRVDRTLHPPRRAIRTKDAKPERERLPWHATMALVALAVFWVALPAAGIAGALWDGWAALAALGLAVSSLVVAYFLGSE